MLTSTRSVIDRTSAACSGNAYQSSILRRPMPAGRALLLATVLASLLGAPAGLPARGAVAGESSDPIPVESQAPIVTAVQAPPTLSAAPLETVTVPPALASPSAFVHAEMVERLLIHQVARGDSLSSLGARYGISTRVLADTIGLEPRRPLRVGQQLAFVSRRLVLSAPFDDGILVNLPQRMLHLYREGRLVHSYPAAVGRSGWQTPTGDFVVVSRQIDKTWIVPPSIQREMESEGKPVLTRVPPGPDNPLGRHWIGLDMPGIGVHGTNAPASVYGFRSHGCIRLHPDDIAQLFDMVSVGEPGRIVYEPLLLARDLQGAVWFEANPDAYRRLRTSQDSVREMARAQGIDDTQLDWPLVEAMLRDRDGLARRIGPIPAP